MKKNVKILYLIIGILACLIVVLGVLVFNKINANNSESLNVDKLDNTQKLAKRLYEEEMDKNNKKYKITDIEVINNDNENKKIQVKIKTVFNKKEEKTTLININKKDDQWKIITLHEIDIDTIKASDIKGESEITDIDLKNEIDKKSTLFLTEGTDKDINKSVVNLSCFDATNLFMNTIYNNGSFRTISEDYKKTAAMYYAMLLEKAYIPSLEEAKIKLKNIFEKEKYGNQSFDDWYNANFNLELKPGDHSYKLVTEKDFLDAYEEIFGDSESLTNYDGIVTCPFVGSYDEEYKVFLLNPNCGDVCYRAGYINKYKYTQKDNYVYVYFRVGEQVGGDYELPSGIYNGMLYDRKLLAEVNDYDYDLSKQIQTNPELFENYRLIFKKNEKGSYIFDKIEFIINN